MFFFQVLVVNITINQALFLSISDTNECAINRLLCNGGQCRNTPGSYRCECPNGLAYDPASVTCQGNEASHCNDSHVAAFILDNCLISSQTN